MALSQTQLNDLKAEAQSLGFSLAGVAPILPPPHYPTYQKWIAEGKHGEMSYLATETARSRRADPHILYPSIQSMLVVALAYPAPPALEPAPALHGRIAAYALGEDYHRRMLRKLDLLAQWVAKILPGNPRSLSYSDTGAILEHDYAQLAGLGWIAKNTCLISPSLGSYFLLGELLLPVDAPPAEPYTADRCGSCTRCIQACPTGCIAADRTVDARRCISYLTIEHRGAIPPVLRPKLGAWIYGCDICQMVCPWNQHIKPSETDDSAPLWVDLTAPVPDNEEAFYQQHRFSVIRRIKRSGWLRNHCIALGNSHLPQALPILEGYLKTEGDSIVREHANWAIAQIRAAN